jgi:hypothetical protein
VCVSAHVSIYQRFKEVERKALQCHPSSHIALHCWDGYCSPILSSTIEKGATMKHYADLGSVFRNSPCIEFPGVWAVYINGGDERLFPTFADAIDKGKELSDIYDNVSICWIASDNDPRIGQVWFTPFYCHGKFTPFGVYKST